MRKWFSATASAVAEVVAPTAKSALEDMKRHWMAIRSDMLYRFQEYPERNWNFYIDQREDVEDGHIPAHLHGVVRVLLEEDDERVIHDGTGPCLEYFLQQRIMETLCALCLVDRPKGVRRIILSAITSLLSSLQVLLIPHMSIHQPLCNLVHGFTSVQLAGEATEAIILIKTLLVLIEGDTTLAEFFISSPSDESVEGSYAIWSSLVSLHSRTAPERREKIEECLLIAVNTANEYVMESMIAAEFAETLVSECLGFHAQLPDQPSNQTIESDQLFRFKLALRFIDKMTSVERGILDPSNMFSVGLFNLMNESFCKTLLPPALSQESATAYYSLYVKEMLQVCTGPLLVGLLDSVVGNNSPVFGILVGRLLSESEVICCNTLRLFDTMLGLYSPKVYHSLFLRHIVSREDGYEPSADEADDETEVLFPQSTFKRLLKAFPCNVDSGTSSTLDSYVWYARETISFIFERLQDDISPSDIKCRTWDRSAQQDVSLGPLLTALLSLLQHSLDQSLKRNLLITSLFSRLLQYPSIPLFQATQFHVLQTMETISLEAEKRCLSLVPKREYIAEALKSSLATLESLRDIEIGSRSDAAEHRLFEALVIFKEFVSELVAIESAVDVYAILITEKRK